MIASTTKKCPHNMSCIFNVVHQLFNRYFPKRNHRWESRQPWGHHTPSPLPPHLCKQNRYYGCHLKLFIFMMKTCWTHFPSLFRIDFQWKDYKLSPLVFNRPHFRAYTYSSAPHSWWHRSTLTSLTIYICSTHFMYSIHYTRITITCSVPYNNFIKIFIF